MAKASFEERKQTLLEKALAAPLARKRSNKVTQEDIDLAFGWLTDRVSLHQVQAAYNGKSPQYKLAAIIKEAYNRGLIDLKDGK